VLGVSADEDPFARAAAFYASESEIEIGEPTFVSRTGGGAYVLCWKWMDNDDAGLMYSELLASLLENVREQLKSPGPGVVEDVQRMNTIADWLENTIAEYRDELDGIGDADIQGNAKPTEVTWMGSGGKHTFFPTEALGLLIAIDKSNELRKEQYECFYRMHAAKLELLLGPVRTD
jgi:hypothetical protein